MPSKTSHKAKVKPKAATRHNNDTTSPTHSPPTTHPTHQDPSHPHTSPSRSISTKPHRLLQQSNVLNAQRKDHLSPQKAKRGKFSSNSGHNRALSTKKGNSTPLLPQSHIFSSPGLTPYFISRRFITAKWTPAPQDDDNKKKNQNQNNNASNNSSPPHHTSNNNYNNNQSYYSRQDQMFTPELPRRPGGGDDELESGGKYGQYKSGQKSPYSQFYSAGDVDDNYGDRGEYGVSFGKYGGGGSDKGARSMDDFKRKLEADKTLTTLEKQRLLADQYKNKQLLDQIEEQRAADAKEEYMRTRKDPERQAIDWKQPRTKDYWEPMKPLPQDLRYPMNHIPSRHDGGEGTTHRRPPGIDDMPIYAAVPDGIKSARDEYKEQQKEMGKRGVLGRFQDAFGQKIDNMTAGQKSQNQHQNQHQGLSAERLSGSTPFQPFDPETFQYGQGSQQQQQSPYQQGFQQGMAGESYQKFQPNGPNGSNFQQNGPLSPELPSLKYQTLRAQGNDLRSEVERGKRDAEDLKRRYQNNLQELGQEAAQKGQNGQNGQNSPNFDRFSFKTPNQKNTDNVSAQIPSALYRHPQEFPLDMPSGEVDNTTKTGEIPKSRKMAPPAPLSRSPPSISGFEHLYEPQGTSAALGQQGATSLSSNNSQPFSFDGVKTNKGGAKQSGEDSLSSMLEQIRNRAKDEIRKDREKAFENAQKREKTETKDHNFNSSPKFKESQFDIDNIFPDQVDLDAAASSASFGTKNDANNTKSSPNQLNQHSNTNDTNNTSTDKKPRRDNTGNLMDDQYVSDESRELERIMNDSAQLDEVAAQLENDFNMNHGTNNNNNNGIDFDNFHKHPSDTTPPLLDRLGEKIQEELNMQNTDSLFEDFRSQSAAGAKRRKKAKQNAQNGSLDPKNAQKGPNSDPYTSPIIDIEDSAERDQLGHLGLDEEELGRLYNVDMSAKRFEELLDNNDDILSKLGEDDPKRAAAFAELERAVMEEADLAAEEARQRRKVTSKGKKKKKFNSLGMEIKGDPSTQNENDSNNIPNDPTDEATEENIAHSEAKLRQKFKDSLRATRERKENRKQGQNDENDENEDFRQRVLREEEEADPSGSNTAAEPELPPDEKQLLNMYGNRVNRTQYLISKVQSETLFITNKDDFFQGINPRTDYRPSKERVEYLQMLHKIQTESNQRQLRDPTFVPPTIDELIASGRLKPPLSDVDDEYSQAAIAQTYNNIAAYEHYLSSLQPRFLPTCNVFSMHSLLTREQLDRSALLPSPSEQPHRTSPQTLLPSVFSPLDVAYRPLFADFLICVRFELKIRNNLPFATEQQRNEERAVYDKHHFKAEYQAYKELYQGKLKEQLQLNPARAFLWDLNDFTLGVSYNELIKQKQKLVDEYNKEAGRLGEAKLDYNDTAKIEDFVMRDQEYATSHRLFRLYRQSFEKSEPYITSSSIGHKHAIIRQQSEFNQYLQWFGDEVGQNNPYHKTFFQRDQIKREVQRLTDVNERYKHHLTDPAARDEADKVLKAEVERLYKLADAKSLAAIRNRQQGVLNNLHQLPSKYDIIVAPVLKTVVSKEEKALEILNDTSLPLIQRQAKYLDRLAEIKERRRLKGLRREMIKGGANGTNSVFQKIKGLLNLSKLKKPADNSTDRPDAQIDAVDESLFEGLSEDTDDDLERRDRDAENYKKDPANRDDETGQPKVITPIVHDDFFPGLREFVANDIVTKTHNLYSFPDLMLITTNDQYLKQYQYLAQQATKDNKAVKTTADDIKDYDEDAVEIGHKYSDRVRNEIDSSVGQDGDEPNRPFDPMKIISDPNGPQKDQNDPNGSNLGQGQSSVERRIAELNNLGGPDHIKNPKDVDQRLTQQLYQNIHFPDDFIQQVHQRVAFEQKERLFHYAKMVGDKATKSYETSIKKYLRKRFPMLTNPDAIQAKVEEEKSFDKNINEIFTNFDSQLEQVLEADIARRQRQTQDARKYHLQKSLSITNKELDLFNRKERELLEQIQTQKGDFLSSIKDIYARNLDQLYTNIQNRDKKERDVLLEQLNDKMVPFVERYKDLEKILFETEKRVLIQHYNQQRFQNLYQKDSLVQLDTDPVFVQLQKALDADTQLQYHTNFRPEFIDEPRPKYTKDGVKLEYRNQIPVSDDFPEDSHLNHRKITPDAPNPIHPIHRSEPLPKAPETAHIDVYNEPFKGARIKTQPDFFNLPALAKSTILHNSLGIAHANEAVQAVYAMKGLSHTKLHAYYNFLGYKADGKSIDDILFHLSKLFGQDTLAKATEYAKILATDEVVVKLHSYRPKHELVTKRAFLLKEYNELVTLFSEMNGDLFREEGRRQDGWSLVINQAPYLNYRARFLEITRLLKQKRQELNVLEDYIKAHGLEPIPLAQPHFDDFRTLFDAFSLAEQRKVKTFMYPYKRDGIYEVLPLATDLPRRYISFALDQADLPDGYVMSDQYHNVRDWDAFVGHRDQIFLDIRSTTATMKELESQLKHYCIAVVEPTLEHFIDVFLGSHSNSTNKQLNYALSIERDLLNTDALRAYKQTKFLAEVQNHSQRLPYTGLSVNSDTSQFDPSYSTSFNQRIIQGDPLPPALDQLHHLRNKELYRGKAINPENGLIEAAPNAMYYGRDPSQTPDPTNDPIATQLARINPNQLSRNKGMDIDPDGVDLNRLRLDGAPGGKLSDELLRQQRLNLPPSQQWRHDDQLQGPIGHNNNSNFPSGNNGNNQLANYFSSSEPLTTPRKTPEQYSRFSFSRLFLPYYRNDSDNNVPVAEEPTATKVVDAQLVQKTYKDVEIEEKAAKRAKFLQTVDKTMPKFMSNYIKRYIKPAAAPKSAIEVEFDEFLRIQTHQYSEEDKLRALRDKDFVIANIQAMRKELLELDTELESLYTQIQRTLPRDLNFIYTPIDVNLTYSKLELLLDIPLVKRPTWKGRDAWSFEKQLEDKENITQAQMNRILSDPFLNIDLVNDTLSRYVLMGKIISDQHGQAQIRKQLLQDDLLLQSINQPPVLIGDDSQGAQQHGLAVVPPRGVNREGKGGFEQDPSDVAELKRQFIESRTSTSHLLKLQNTIQQEQQLLAQAVDFEAQSREAQELARRIEKQNLFILRKKFPHLPIEQLITEYNNQLPSIINDSNKLLAEFEDEQRQQRTMRNGNNNQQNINNNQLVSTDVKALLDQTFSVEHGFDDYEKQYKAAAARGLTMGEWKREKQIEENFKRSQKMDSKYHAIFSPHYISSVQKSYQKLVALGRNPFQGGANGSNNNDNNNINNNTNTTETSLAIIPPSNLSKLTHLASKLTSSLKPGLAQKQDELDELSRALGNQVPLHEEYSIYSKLLQHSRAELDRLYQQHYPHLSKLDRLKLNPVVVRQRVQPMVPDKALIYEKNLDDHQLTMWNYIKQRNRAQSLIQERLHHILPPYKTKADVRLAMMSREGFISRDDIPEDPTPELEHFVSYFNTLPEKIAHLEHRANIIQQLPEYLTFLGRVSILDSILEKRFGYDQVLLANKRHAAMVELDQIKPDVVKEYEAIPVLLEQLRDERDGDDLKLKVRELSQKRKEYLEIVQNYSTQEAERIKMEHMAIEYQSISTMVENEYLLQLNILFEQNLINQDKQFIQNYNKAKIDFTNIVHQFLETPVLVRGFYDKMAIIGQTNQWCVNSTYVGPKIKKFLKHPKVRKEHEARLKRQEKLRMVNKSHEFDKRVVDEVDTPYDQRKKARQSAVRESLIKNANKKRQRRMEQRQNRKHLADFSDDEGLIADFDDGDDDGVLEKMDEEIAKMRRELKMQNKTTNLDTSSIQELINKDDSDAEVDILFRNTSAVLRERQIKETQKILKLQRDIIVEQIKHDRLVCLETGTDDDATVDFLVRTGTVAGIDKEADAILRKTKPELVGRLDSLEIERDFDQDGDDGLDVLFDDFDSMLLRQLHDESFLYVDYDQDTEPPLDPQGNPIEFVILPHHNAFPGLQENKSLYIQLKQHNSIARLINHQYAIIERMPGGAQRIIDLDPDAPSTDSTRLSPTNLIANVKSMFGAKGGKGGPEKASKGGVNEALQSAQTFLESSIKRSPLGNVLLSTNTSHKDPDAAKSTHQIPLFSVEELVMAKKMDRIQAAVNIFSQFNVKYLYPDVISSRRRVVDQENNVAYLVTNPHVLDRANMMTQQEKIQQQAERNRKQEQQMRLNNHLSSQQQSMSGIQPSTIGTESKYTPFAPNHYPTNSLTTQNQNAPNTNNNNQNPNGTAFAKKTATAPSTTDLINILTGEVKVFTDLVSTALMDLEDRQVLPQVHASIRKQLSGAVSEYNEYVKQYGQGPDNIPEDALRQIKLWLGPEALVSQSPGPDPDFLGPQNDPEAVNRLATLDDRYRRTILPGPDSPFETIKAEFFDWQGVLENLNTVLMDPYETIQHRQYELDLFNAECEEAIELYRKLRVFPDVQQSYAEQLIGFNETPFLPDGPSYDATSNALLGPNQRHQRPESDGAVVLNYGEPTSAYSTHNIRMPKINPSPEPLLIATGAGSSTVPVPARGHGGEVGMNNHVQPSQQGSQHNQHNQGFQSNQYPQSQPQQDPSLQSQTQQYPQSQSGVLEPDLIVQSQPRTRPQSFFNRFSETFLDISPDKQPHIPNTGFLQYPLGQSTPIITSNTGHSILRSIFTRRDGDQHRHDLEITGADIYHPQTLPDKQWPKIDDSDGIGFKRARRWLKSTQEIMPINQPDFTTTFQDYLTQLVRSRRWAKTTAFESMQVYRDKVAARREEKVNQLMAKQLKHDLTVMKTQQGGLDQILLYNHKLKFRREKLDELAQNENKVVKGGDDKLIKFNLLQDPTQFSYLGATRIPGPMRLPWTTDTTQLRQPLYPQHELDIHQQEEMDVLVYNQHVDSLTHEEKEALVDEILKNEFERIAVDDSYYNDWAVFPSLQDYKKVYARFYGVDSDGKNYESVNVDREMERGDGQPLMQKIADNYQEKSKNMQYYFGKQLLEIDSFYQQHKEKARATQELTDLTEMEYHAKLEKLLKEKELKQKAANLYFLQQQNAAFLHTPYGVEIYQKRQTRRVIDPETIIEREQEKLRHTQLQLEQDGSSNGLGDENNVNIGEQMATDGVTDLIKLRPDVVKNQVADRGRKYFDSFDTDKVGYPTKPVSFTDFVDIKTRMSLGTTMYGSVVQTPAVHQYHDALDPAPLPPHAPPPSFRDYNKMHPDRLGYFITYYDAYRLKQPPESPFREYKIERPDFFQLLSFYPTWTLDGNYVWTPTKDPFEQAKDPSRADLFGTKFSRFKLYYLYYFLYGLLRPSVVLYLSTGLLLGNRLVTSVGKFAPEWSEPIDMANDYSLALNTYLPIMPF